MELTPKERLRLANIITELRRNNFPTKFVDRAFELAQYDNDAYILLDMWYCCDNSDYTYSDNVIENIKDLINELDNEKIKDDSWP